MSNITIDQDTLCESCSHKDEKSREGMMLCEGRYCDEARESYLEDNGLVEDDKTIFGNISYGDTLYIVSDVMKALTVESASVSKDFVEFRFQEDNACAKVAKNLSCHDGFVDGSLFINKEDALAKYEKMMLEQIKEMAMTIAKFS